MLSVTEEAQILHFKITVQCFLEAGRRLRASARPRVRWSPAAFEAHCDFACVIASVLREARQLASFNPEKEDAILKAFNQKFLGCQFLVAFLVTFFGLVISQCQGLRDYFFAQSICLPRDYWQEIEAAVASKLSTWKLQHLGIWTDIVEPPSAPMQVHSATELMDIEEESQAAKFREVRAKLAQDVASMTQHLSGMEESKRRAHVVMVMHERSQMQIGKGFTSAEFQYCFVLDIFFVLFCLCFNFGVNFDSCFC